MINSADDPQLPRCLEAVRNQTVLFSKIIHKNNICPAAESYNQGMAETTGEWVMHIIGDMILDLDGIERITGYMERDNSDRISGYYFGLYDTFLNCKIGYVGVLRGSLYRTLRFENSYMCDVKIVNKLRSEGWEIRKTLNFLVGTHFDNPDEFQVFKRCYVHGIRYADKPEVSLKWKLIELQKKENNSLYKLGIGAVEFAERKKFYPGSHNLIFDRENYEEYKRCVLQ